MQVRGARYLDLVPADPRDVKHDQDIDSQHDPVQLVRVFDHLPDFKWQIDAAGDDGQPLSPCALLPQSVALNEAQGGVRDRNAKNVEDAGAGKFADGVEKLVREMPVRIDVQVKQDVFGGVLEVDVVANHANEDVGADQRQATL